MTLGSCLFVKKDDNDCSKPTRNGPGGPDMGSDKHLGGRGLFARPGQNEDSPIPDGRCRDDLRAGTYCSCALQRALS
jgi:hypothetical protein